MKAQDFLTKYGKDGRITRSEIKDHFSGNLANLESKAKNFGVMIGEKGLEYIKQELGSQQAPIPYALGVSVADVKNVEPIFPREFHGGPFVGPIQETTFVGPIQEGPEGFYEAYGADGKITREELKNHFTGNLENVERKAANKGIKLGDKAIAYIRNQLAKDEVTPSAPGSTPVVVNQPETQTENVDSESIVDQITSGAGADNISTTTDSTDYSFTDTGAVDTSTDTTPPAPPTPYVPTKEDRKRSAEYDKTQYGFNPTAYLAAYSDVADLAKGFAGEGTSDEEKVYLGYINASRGANFSDFNQMNTKDLYQSVAQQHFGLHGFHEGRQSKEEYQAKEQEFEEGKLDDFIKGLKDAVVSSSAAGAQAGGVSGL